MDAFSRLAVIAGGGDFPRVLAEGCAGRDVDYFVVGLQGFAGEWVHAHPHLVERMTRPAAILRRLRAEGCDALTMAGALARPPLSELRLDRMILAHLPRILALLRAGDDALLRGVIDIVEAQGLRVVAPNAILPEISAGRGAQGLLSPGAADREDIRQGARILRALAAQDVGQAVVVAGGLCLGIETLEGTDALLARVAAFDPSRRRAAPPPCGVLYKAPKHGQERRVDMPVIGPETVRGAARAGLNGIAYEAERVLLLDAGETIRMADEARLFLYGDGCTP